MEYQQTPVQYEQAFIHAMNQHGLGFRDKLIANGKIHRFARKEKGSKDCWYVSFGLAGAFGDWSRDIQGKWSFKQEDLSIQEKEVLRQQIEQTKRITEEERLNRHEEVAGIALKKWESFSGAGSSPYLTRKKVEAFGVSFDGEDIVIPLRDTTGKFWSFQRIAPNGAKRFLTGGRKKGCFHMLGFPLEGKPIYVVEGYATAASVYMATQAPTVVTFDAGNLEPVIEELRTTYPKNPLIIGGDDDQWAESNVGRIKSEESAQKYGCSVVFPKFKNTESKPTDFNDLHVLEGLEEVKRQLEQDRLEKTPLRSSLVQELEPLAVENGLLPVLPFTLDMLPEPLQNWAKDVAYRRQCPLDFVAIPAIIMIASIIGARCSIKPHTQDDWTVVPNLWGGLLGDPGTLKSPVCSDVLFPFGHLELTAKEEYFEQKNHYEAEKIAFLEAKKALENKIKALIEKEESDLSSIPSLELKSLKEKLSLLLKSTPPEPILKRYKLSDTTLEKIHEILSQNPGGVLIFRDELMGFLESWEKKGHESDRSFYLEAWNGDKPYTIDRIGRGTVHASNICVSLLGTTQPDKIATYLRKSIKDLDNDGLLQRFQLLVYPDKKPWSLVDQRPCYFARGRVLNICKVLPSLVFTNYGARQEEPLYEGQHLVPYYRFTSEAQKFFHEWITQLQAKLDGKACSQSSESIKDQGKGHPIILQHLSKYRSLMPSLALIFHLIRVADGTGKEDISLEATQQAALWCDYLESHARRIYGMGIEATLPKVDELLAWMGKQPHNPENPLKRRFILRYSKFRSLKDLVPLLSDLCEMGYVQESPVGCYWVAS